MSQNCLCKICGRFFESEITAEYCPECRKVDEEMYTSVRNYLLEKPRASIFDVTTELKIPIKAIKRFLREDRLEVVEAQNGFLKCEKCGKSVHSGYFCKDCKYGRNGNNNETVSNVNEKSSATDQLDVKNDKKLKYL